VTARFFPSARAFRSWLARHHDSETELWVGFHKKHTGKKGLQYLEAVEEALCYGWIDGLMHPIDAESFRQRFTPRKRTSSWSAVNLKRVEALVAAGRMMPPGMAAWQQRDTRKDAQYLFERGAAAFSPEQERAFRRQKAAWTFWEKQPPGYRRLATHWVTSAKREETRARRLTQLMARCAAGQRLPGA
jgi:uncharacterized protein YdeI (YjbR/CyaY-like superfamily)